MRARAVEITAVLRSGKVRKRKKRAGKVKVRGTSRARGRNAAAGAAGVRKTRVKEGKVRRTNDVF